MSKLTPCSEISPTVLTWAPHETAEGGRDRTNWGLNIFVGGAENSEDNKVNEWDGRSMWMENKSSDSRSTICSRNSSKPELQSCGDTEVLSSDTGLVSCWSQLQETTCRTMVQTPAQCDGEKQMERLIGSSLHLLEMQKCEYKLKSRLVGWVWTNPKYLLRQSNKKCLT